MPATNPFYPPINQPTFHYRKEPADWQAVTATHTYEDQGKAFNRLNDVAPQRWHRVFQFDLRRQADVDNLAIFVNHYNERQKSLTFPFTQKRGLVIEGCRYEFFDFPHEGHKSWLPTLTITIICDPYAGSRANDFEVPYLGAVGVMPAPTPTPTPSPSALSFTSPSALPAATTGVSYTYQFQAAGGTPPYTFAGVAGNLNAPPTPAGLLTISNPQGSGYSTVIRVTDAGGSAAIDKSFTIAVNPANTPGGGAALSGYTITNPFSLKALNETDGQLSDLRAYTGTLITDLQAGTSLTGYSGAFAVTRTVNFNIDYNDLVKIINFARTVTEDKIVNRTFADYSIAGGLTLKTLDVNAAQTEDVLQILMQVADDLGATPS